MTKVRLSAAISWAEYEKAVHGVFLEALRQLCQRAQLSPAEPAITLELYWFAQKVHQEQFLAKQCLFPFTIEPDSTNKPQPDDSSVSPRLKKRPDFACTMKDMQASTIAELQISYYLECKRLGRPKENLVFNDLYSEKGIARFMTQEHQYGKGCPSAAMIGYIEDMPPDDVLTEVNTFAGGRGIPSLQTAAAQWAKKNATTLPQDSLRRSFDTTPIKLHHFWVDLRDCQFDLPSDQPPQSAGNPAVAVAGNRRSRESLVDQQARTKRPAEKIAILAWGSLLWEPDVDFDAQHGRWETNGPTLKLEYSRVSQTKRPEALTLVIDEANGVLLPVQWSLSRRTSVADARKDLRDREGAKSDEIRIIRIDEPYGPFSVGSVEAEIANWAVLHSLTAVIWTGLPSNFEERVGKPFSPANAIAHLKGLSRIRQSKAVEYIRNTLPFIQTPLRTEFQNDPAFGP